MPVLFWLLTLLQWLAFFLFLAWALIRLATDVLGALEVINDPATAVASVHKALGWLYSTPWWVPGLLAGIATLILFWQRLEAIAKPRTKLQPAESELDSIHAQAEVKRRRLSSNAAAPLPPAASRTFTHLTARQLIAFFETPGLSRLQASKLVEPHYGLWLEADTSVINVLADTLPDHSYGYFKDAGGAEIECRFAPRWIRHVLALRPGEVVRLVGKIRQVTNTDVFLSDCEVVPGAMKAERPILAPQRPGTESDVFYSPIVATTLPKIETGLNVADIRLTFGDLEKDRHSELTIRVFNGTGRVIELGNLSGHIKFNAPNNTDPSRMETCPRRLCDPIPRGPSISCKSGS
jgi:hypothetical protein